MSCMTKQYERVFTIYASESKIETWQWIASPFSIRLCQTTQSDQMNNQTNWEKMTRLSYEERIQ